MSVLDLKSLNGLFVADGRIDRLTTSLINATLFFVDAFDTRFRLEFNAVVSLSVGSCVGTSLSGLRITKGIQEVEISFYDSDGEAIVVQLSLSSGQTAAVFIERI